MHDGIFFEEKGIPTATAVSSEFIDAANIQARSLGFPSYKVIPVEHPIQILTNEEVKARAEGSFNTIISQLISE